LLYLSHGFSKCITTFLSKLEAFSSLLKIKVKLIIELCEVLSLLLGKAVCSVVSVSLGELANISFPAQILTINERDSLISLFVGLMFLVSVEPRCGSPIASLSNFHLYFLLFNMCLVGLLSLCALGLYFFLLNRFRSDFVLSSDNGNFDCVRLRLDRDRLLHLVVGLLLSVETVDLMLVHAIPFFAYGWNGLHETDHSFVALGVEFAVVTRLNVVEFLGSLSLWKGRYLGFDCVLEVGKETKTIFQLDLEGLVIDC